jgi:hypothetical protein
MPAEGYYENDQILARPDPKKKKPITPVNGAYAFGIGGSNKDNTCCVGFMKTLASGAPKTDVYKQIVKELKSKTGVKLDNISIGQILISGSAPTLKLNKLPVISQTKLKDLLSSESKKLLANPTIELDPRFDSTSGSKDDKFIGLLKLLRESAGTSSDIYRQRIDDLFDEFMKIKQGKQLALDPNSDATVSSLTNGFAFTNGLLEASPPDEAKLKKAISKLETLIGTLNEQWTSFSKKLEAFKEYLPIAKKIKTEWDNGFVEVTKHTSKLVTDTMLLFADIDESNPENRKFKLSIQNQLTSDLQATALSFFENNELVTNWKKIINLKPGEVDKFATLKEQFESGFNSLSSAFASKSSLDLVKQFEHTESGLEISKICSGLLDSIKTNML